MENYDQVGKFEDIAENSEGSTKEKMDIYGDSLEAAQNRKMVAIEEFSLNFNILGMDGVDILKKWNDTLTYIIKNASKLLQIFAVILTYTKGIKGEGLARLVQSLGTSLNSWGTQYSAIGSNNKGWFGKFANWGNGVGAGSESLKASQAHQSSMIYNTAMKQGMKMKLGDGIELDRGANFLSGMNAKQLKAWNMLDAKEQLALIKQYGQEDPLLLAANALKEAAAALKESASQSEGVDKNPDSDNGTSSNNGTATVTKNGKSTGITAHPKDSGNNQPNAPSENDPEKIKENLVKGSEDAAKIQTNAAGAEANTEINAATEEANIELSAAKLKALEEAGLIGDKGYIANSGVYQTDSGMVTSMSGSKPVLKQMQKGSRLSSYKGAITAAGGMAGTMIASTVNSHVTDSSDTTESTVGTIASMAPMIGSMFGPWGVAIGSLVGIASGIFTWLHKTDAEKRLKILDEAKKANEILDKHLSAIEKNTQKKDELKNYQARFSELIKGVNTVDQSNISLDESEWEEYLSILKKIIEASDELYESYDYQGNIIAKSSKGFVDLVDLLKEAQDDLDRDTLDHSEMFISSVSKRRDSIKGTMQGFIDENQGGDNEENDWGMNQGKGYDYWSNLSKDDIVIAIAAGILGGPFGGVLGGLTVGAISNMIETHQKESEINDIEKTVRKMHDEGKSEAEIRKYIRENHKDGYFSVEDLDAAVKGLYSDQLFEKNLADKTDKEFTREVLSDMGIKAMSMDTYQLMTEDNQKFLKNLFGTVTYDWYKRDKYGNLETDEDGNYIQKEDMDIDRILNQSTAIAENLTNWVAANGTAVDFLNNFNQNTATDTDWKQYHAIIKDMINVGARADTNNDGVTDLDDKVDGKYITSAQDQMNMLIGQGYTIKEGAYVETVTTEDGRTYTKWVDKDGNDIEDISPYILDLKLTLWESADFKDIADKLTGKEMGTSDFTFGDLAQMNEHRYDASFLNLLKNSDTTKNEIINFLKQSKLGTSGSVSEQYSMLTSEMSTLGLDISSIENIKNNLNNSDIKETYAYKSLEEMASILLADGTKGIEYLIENMEIFGNIDPFFRTKKSLEEMNLMFDDLSNIFDDLSDNDKLSAENILKALQAYPDELLPLINDVDAFTEKVAELYSNRQLLLASPIKTSLDLNTKIYIDGVDEIADLIKGRGTIGLDEEAKNILKSFGSVENISKIVANYNTYGINKDGSVNQGYFNTGLKTNAHTFEKDLMDVFGINRTGSFETAQNNLELKLKDLFFKAGVSYETNGTEWSYDKLLGTWGDYVKDGKAELVSDYLSKVNYLESLKASRDLLENEAYEKAIDKSLSELETNYSSGLTSVNDYIDGLRMLAQAAEEGSEQLKKLNQMIADAEFDKFTSQFEEGILTLQQYNDEMSRTISMFVVGSEEWNKRVLARKDAYDTENQKIDYEIEMLEDDDYDLMLSLWDKKIENGYRKLALIEAEGETKAKDSNLVYDKYLDVEWLEARDLIRGIEESRTEIYDDMFQSYTDDYEQGNIGLLELVDSISNLRKLSGLTRDLLEKLSEAEEDYRITLSRRNYEDGKTTGDEYRSDLLSDVQKNALGSQEERDSLNQMLSSYDEDIEKINQQIQLLDEHDYDAKALLLNDSLDSVKSKMILLEAMGLKGSSQWLETLQKGADLQKEILDNQKASLEYLVEQSREVLDSYSSIVNYGIQEIKDHQQDINDMYDDEISKLQDINDLKKRSIELTRLQQELENAKKNKVRVYTAGIGWNYQENKASVKKAQENLDNYLEERKIQDLLFAQKALNELFQEQIDKLQDIIDYIDHVNQSVTATEALLNLIYKGIMPGSTSLPDAIKLISNSAINGPDGKISLLDEHFENYSRIFTDKSSDLNILMDSYDKRLDDIQSYWSTSYLSPSDLVEDLLSKITDKILGDGSSGLNSIESKITDFISGRQYGDWTDEMTGSIASAASSIVASISQINNSAIDAAIKLALDAVDQAKQVLANNGYNEEIKPSGYSTDALESFPVYNTKEMSTTDGKYIYHGGVYYKTSDVTQTYKNGGYYISIKKGTPYYTESDLTTNGYVPRLNPPAPIPPNPSVGYNQWGFAYKKDSEGHLLYYLMDVPDTSLDRYTQQGNHIYDYETGLLYTISNGRVVDIAAGGSWGVKLDPGYNDEARKAAASKNFYSKISLTYSFSDGIENGPVTYTGLAMLHGSPSSPEYVLNSDQAGTLLKNLATMTMSPYLAPKVDSYNRGEGSTVYQFTGDLNLPNVQRPDQFFNELLKLANVQFPTIKRNYL